MVEAVSSDAPGHSVRADMAFSSLKKGEDLNCIVVVAATANRSMRASTHFKISGSVRGLDAEGADAAVTKGLRGCEGCA